jgi:hypothetical protein
VAERTHYLNLVFDSSRWDGFELRADDVIISTPAKCGTTWMQMICALVLFQTPELDRPLSELSPWLDMTTEPRADVVARLEAQTHRRFIKSHTPLDGLPWDDRVTYITVGRDPRDVAISWFNHFDNFNMLELFEQVSATIGNEAINEFLAAGPPLASADPVERFWDWVEDPTPYTAAFSLHSTLHHLATFWEARDRPNVSLFHYADLMADLPGEMRRVAAALGAAIDDDHWPALVEAAGFEAMKSRAGDLAPGGRRNHWLDVDRFFHRGGTGQWQDRVEGDGLARYDAVVEALIPADLAAWTHGGWSAVGGRP